jgi:deazaflavin-dependent oxidoreductase (nitroreductase family)
MIRAFAAAQRTVYRTSRGRLWRTFAGAPCILLTTTGRRTGRERTTPLLALPEGDGWVVAASYAGHDRHPSWYVNLRASGRGVLFDGSRTVSVEARVLDGDERQRRWQRMVDLYPRFVDYQEATDRSGSRRRAPSCTGVASKDGLAHHGRRPGG